MKYLNTKPGSIEEVVANMSKHQNESGYQDMFKKELEKAGKGIGAMTPAEKKAFFNKIDDKYKAKNEDIKEGRYEVTGTVTYQGVSGEDEVTVVVDAMDKMDAEDVADDMIDDLRRKKKIGPKRGGQVKRFDPFDVEYTRKKEGLVDSMMEKVDEPYAVGMAQAMKSTGDKPPLKKSTITKAHDIAKSIAKDDKKEEVTEAKYPHKMYSKDGKEVEAKTPEDHKKYADMGYTHKEDMKEDVQEAVRIVAKNGNFKKTFQTRKQAADYLQKHPELDDAKIIAEADLSKKQIKMVHNETHTFMTKDMNKSKKDAKGEKEIVDPEPKLKQESIQDAIANVWKMSAEELEKIKTEAKYMKAQRMSQYKAENEKNKKGMADTGSKETKVDVEPSVDYKN